MWRFSCVQHWAQWYAGFLRLWNTNPPLSLADELAMRVNVETVLLSVGAGGLGDQAVREHATGFLQDLAKNTPSLSSSPSPSH